MASNFNKTWVTQLGNQGTTMTAFDKAYIPALSFALKINIPNPQALQKFHVDFILHEIIRGVIQPQIVDRQTFLIFTVNSIYTTSGKYHNATNFYVRQVNVTSEVNLGGAVDISTLCYHI